MPIVRDDWPLVFNAVRAVHPTTPIIILGGHTHIRNCVQLDGRSMSLESGRYMETVGWLSAKLDHKGSKKNITFSRRYLDPNRVTYEFHTKRNNFDFDTVQGLAITAGLNNLAKKYDLSFLYGTAPHDFYLSRAPYPSNDSLLSLFAQDAMPVALAINNSRASIPNIMITNSGSQRFDVFSGTFTKNDQLTASPFADTFLFIPNVTFATASKVLPALNNAGADERRRSFLEDREQVLYGHGYVETIYRKWLEEQDRRDGLERRAAQNLTLGYVTQDSCPGVGDDILHAPLPFFDSPDFIGSNSPTVSADTPIDLVFVDFIESQLLGILNSVQSEKKYTESDVQSYSPFLASELLGLYAQVVWN
ncbi:hypothetical protein CVT26_004176 [Gymnopilus dilepis]|uniref:Putative 5'-nucleotidase C-terminal domain-containing protein n=1 Tax=Gymnopilus dilepis TaxID=231916 RepID=A0A409WN38_9AGAR|nr:hypothetical protein CVT26_004176 [Gymnopilus dilepis]